jgi:hypothetical protein
VPTTSVRGVKVELPDDWVDNSILRFIAPVDTSDPLVTQGFTQNVVVTTHAVPPTVPFAEVFVAPNRSAKEKTQDFEVLGGSECQYLGQAAVYQDVSFSDPRVNTILCQRQVALRADDGQMVFLTMTSDKKRFKKAAAAFPVEVSAKKKER